MNIQERIYADAQKASGLKVGDMVKVVDPKMGLDDYWFSEWEWTREKETMVGEVYKILEVLDYGINVGNRIFPYFALQKLTYEEAQELSGLKVGDWVKITRKAKDGENGWENNWLLPADENINKIGIIRNIHGNKGIEVFASNGINNTDTIGYKYPFFVLEKVPTPEQKPEPEKNFNDHNFKPFDKVLVRDYDTETWKCDFFSCIGDRNYRCVSGFYLQCIPYEGNEYLVGTTLI